MTYTPSECECGGTVRLMAAPGRTWYHGHRDVPIPADYLLPTCDRCGEEFTTPEYEDPLEKILDAELARLEAKCE